MKTITICMGSSCFSRGNSTNAEVIQRFIADNGLEDKFSVRGCQFLEQHVLFYLMF